jgi:glycosyltransferase involved in cell wall biosynthesis
MSSPLVSVIIPNYEHGRFLKQRIDTVLGQTYDAFELIILDDCSTDNSRDVIESYRGDPRISHIVYNHENSGSPFIQWKKGIDLAAGQWIWIAESDDYADLTFLEKMVNAASRHDQLGLVYCDSKIVTGEMVQERTFATLKNERFKTNRWSSDHRARGVDELENYILSDGIINNTSAVLFNKGFLLKASPFDFSLRYIGDKYAFVKVLMVSDLAFVHEPLNYFRDPFNTRHHGKIISIVFEHFLVFDWVLRHRNGLDYSKIMSAFHANTRTSLVRGWNLQKLLIFLKMLGTNPGLWWRYVAFNVGMSTKRTKS